MSRAKRPLNKTAVEKADADFYKNHPELKGQPLSTTTPKQKALRREWMNSYTEHGGEVETLQENSATIRNQETTHTCSPKLPWITIKLVDEAGQPVPNERYKITLPDGVVKEGELNGEGSAHVKNIKQGNCQVTFPDLDESAWEKM